MKTLTVDDSQRVYLPEVKPGLSQYIVVDLEIRHGKQPRK